MKNQGGYMANIYIVRDRVKNFVLTSFFNDKTIGSKEGEEQVVFYISGAASESERDDARLYTYKAVDNSVELWIQEKRYFPRLLVCALTFLVVYFFMSLVIRDPIPMLDELVGSTLATVAMWYYISKKDKKGPITNKKKLEIKREVGNAEFKELEGLSIIEAYLDNLRSLENIDLSDRLLNVDNINLEELKFDDMDDSFISQLRTYFNQYVFTLKPEMKKYFNLVESIRLENKSDEALSSKLVQLDRDAKIDLPLLTLLIVLKEYRMKTAGFLD
jgi:hypothetical protein